MLTSVTHLSIGILLFKLEPINMVKRQNDIINNAILNKAHRSKCAKWDRVRPSQCAICYIVRKAESGEGLTRPVRQEVNNAAKRCNLFLTVFAFDWKGHKQTFLLKQKSYMFK